MKDVQLRARLLALGISESDASRLTADLRDRLHPVAALAVTKAADHLNGLALYDAGVGFAGLDEYGYAYDGTAGLLKKIGKAVKKVAKTTVNVVGKAASIVAPVVPVAAVVAGAYAVGKAATSNKGKVSASMKSGKVAGSVAYNTMDANQLAVEQARLNTMIAAGKDVKDAKKKLANVQTILSSAGYATTSTAVSAPTVADPVAVVAAPVESQLVKSTGRVSASMRSGKKVGSVPYVKMDPAQLAAEQARLAAMITSGKDVKDATEKLENVQELLTPGVPTTSTKIARGGKLRVQRDLSKASDRVAKEVVESGAPLDTAALLQAMIQNQGGGGGGVAQQMSSPGGQAVLQDVAAEGVEATSAIPATTPKWAVPAIIGVGAFGLFLIAKNRRK